MRFLKREKTILERQQAVQTRLDEIKKQIQSKEKSIAAAREYLSNVLGNLALADTPENQDAAKRAKHALSRQSDGLEDLRTMCTVLEMEQKNLAVESLRANIREAPAKAATTAQQFNLLLDKAVEVVGIFREIHAGLVKAEDEYYAILKGREQALLLLNEHEPLTLPPDAALGKLAGLQASPHTLRHSMASNLFDRCLNIRLVQDVLGHASIQQTARYVHVNMEDKKAVMESLYQ